MPPHCDRPSVHALVDVVDALLLHDRHISSHVLEEVRSIFFSNFQARIHRADPSKLVSSIDYATVDACLPENSLCRVPNINTVARSFRVWEDEGVCGCNPGFTLNAEHIHRLDTVFWHKARHQVVCPCQSTETMLALVLLDHTLLSDSIIGVDTATSPSSADLVHCRVGR